MSYGSLRDFLAKADLRPIEAENLVRVGALDDLGSIPTLLHQLEHGGWHGGQLSLFSMGESSQEDWSLAQKVAAQEDILGTGVTSHPLEQVEDEIGVVNMAIGAWYAGARAMVTTSGGGFALMTEGISLAGMIDHVEVLTEARP